MRTVTLALLISMSCASFSQNKYGGWNITAGATHSIWRWVHKRPFKDFDTDWKFTVGTQVNLDVSLIRRFSVGIGAVYHRHNLEVENYSFHSGGQLIEESPTHTIAAFGAYYRLMVHMLSIYDDSIEELDVYWGGGHQFMSYTTSNNSADPNFYTDSGEFNDYLYVAAGVRYYPTEWFGFHAEVAFPGPYTISLGTTFRFGGRETLFR